MNSSDPQLELDSDDDTVALWSALREVMDPEVPVSLVDLGLIYDVRKSGSGVEVDLSFTATACPAMGFIQEDIRERLRRGERCGFGNGRPRGRSVRGPAARGPGERRGSAGW